MALNKKVTFENGVEVSYWKVNSFTISNTSKNASITVIPYVSEEARFNGKKPLSEYAITLSVKDFDYSGTPYEERTNLDYTDHFSPKIIESSQVDIYKIVYNYLKNTEKFDGATDC